MSPVPSRRLVRPNLALHASVAGSLHGPWWEGLRSSDRGAHGLKAADYHAYALPTSPLPLLADPTQNPDRLHLAGVDQQALDAVAKTLS